MTTGVYTLSPDASVTAAAELLKKHDIGALPVVDASGNARGMITDRDIVLRCAAEGESPDGVKVREIMSRGIVGISPEADLAEAADLMAKKRLRRLPVLSDGQVVGMLSLCDLATSRSYQMEAGKALSDISLPQQ